MSDKRKEVVRALVRVVQAAWDCVALFGVVLLVRSMSKEGAHLFADGMQDRTVVYTIQGDIDSDIERIRQDIARMSNLREN